jgi:hypothetical protein
MAQQRIIDFIEATAPAADDYLLMDSEANGTQKILVSKIGGGGSDCVNPNYEWWANEDMTIVIRVQKFQNDIYNYNHFRIYFNWFDINTTVAPFQELMQPPFLTTNPSHSVRNSPFIKNNCSVYAECDQSDYGGAADAHGYIGFYDGTIRGWTVGGLYNQVGKYRAIMESTDNGTVDNPTPWEEPTFDPING